MQRYLSVSHLCVFLINFFFFFCDDFKQIFQESRVLASHVAWKRAAEDPTEESWKTKDYSVTIYIWNTYNPLEEML